VTRGARMKSKGHSIDLVIPQATTLREEATRGEEEMGLGTL